VIERVVLISICRPAPLTINGSTRPRNSSCFFRRADFVFFGVVLSFRARRLTTSPRAIERDLQLLSQLLGWKIVSKRDDVVSRLATKGKDYTEKTNPLCGRSSSNFWAWCSRLS